MVLMIGMGTRMLPNIVLRGNKGADGMLPNIVPRGNKGADGRLDSVLYLWFRNAMVLMGDMGTKMLPIIVLKG